MRRVEYEDCPRLSRGVIGHGVLVVMIQMQPLEVEAKTGHSRLRHVPSDLLIGDIFSVT